MPIDFSSFAFDSRETMCSRKSLEFYLSGERKGDAKESLSCFSLNLSELSTQTAIRNVRESSIQNRDKLRNNFRINQSKGKKQEAFHSEKLYQPKSHGDIDSIQKFDKVSNYSFNLSDFSGKPLHRNGSKVSQKSKSKFTNTDKSREIALSNEHFMKKLQKAKPTTSIRKSTSEMALLQVRSEKHVPAASIRRRQHQAEIDAINRIMLKKLNAIATKKT